jgi:uncharacterized membrane protein YhaH (DUF805 family)
MKKSTRTLLIFVFFAILSIPSISFLLVLVSLVLVNPFHDREKAGWFLFSLSFVASSISIFTRIGFKELEPSETLDNIWKTFFILGWCFVALMFFIVGFVYAF